METFPEVSRQFMCPEQRYPNIHGDYTSPEDVELAIDILADKDTLIIDNDSVFAVIGDAYSDHFIDEVSRLKKSEAEKVYSTMLDSAEVNELVDHSKLRPQDVWIFENAQNLLSGLSFIRFPIKKDVVNLLPNIVKSYDERTDTYWMQNYDPHHKSNLSNILNKAKPMGLGLPVITSLNLSGEREIIHPQSANQHIDGMGQFILHDSSAKRGVRGSFAIFEFSTAGIKMIREGNIAADVFTEILYGTAIDQTAAKPTKYPEHQLNLSDCPDLHGKSGESLAHELRKYLQWQTA